MSEPLKTAPITTPTPFVPQAAQASAHNGPAALAQDPLADLDQSGKVKLMAQKVLEIQNADSHEKAMTGTKIYTAAIELFPGAGVPENTFKQYLSKWVKDPTCEINRLSKKQGYYLSAAAKALEANADEPVIEPQAKLMKGGVKRKNYSIPFC